MDKLIEALGPWPMVQGMVLGLVVAAIGIWAMRRGMQENSLKGENAIEDIRARWELQKAIGHIHENSFEMVEQLKRGNDLAEQMVSAVNRLNDTRWNAKQ